MAEEAIRVEGRGIGMLGGVMIRGRGAMVVVWGTMGV